MKITIRQIRQFEAEILSASRPGISMAEADPLGALLQKKIARWISEQAG